jgi:hypothetical protein
LAYYIYLLRNLKAGRLFWSSYTNATQQGDKQNSKFVNIVDVRDKHVLRGKDSSSTMLERVLDLKPPRQWLIEGRRDWFNSESSIIAAHVSFTLLPLFSGWLLFQGNCFLNRQQLVTPSCISVTVSVCHKSHWNEHYGKLVIAWNVLISAQNYFALVYNFLLTCPDFSCHHWNSVVQAHNLQILKLFGIATVNI